jgi:hypothetical protein
MKHFASRLLKRYLFIRAVLNSLFSLVDGT